MQTKEPEGFGDKAKRRGSEMEGSVQRKRKHEDKTKTIKDFFKGVSQPKEASVEECTGRSSNE